MDINLMTAAKQQAKKKLAILTIEVQLYIHLVGRPPARYERLFSSILAHLLSSIIMAWYCYSLGLLCLAEWFYSAYSAGKLSYS